VITILCHPCFSSFFSTTKSLLLFLNLINALVYIYISSLILAPFQVIMNVLNSILKAVNNNSHIAKLISVSSVYAVASCNVHFPGTTRRLCRMINSFLKGFTDEETITHGYNRDINKFIICNKNGIKKFGGNNPLLLSKPLVILYTRYPSFLTNKFSKIQGQLQIISVLLDGRLDVILFIMYCKEKSLLLNYTYPHGCVEINC